MRFDDEVKKQWDKKNEYINQKISLGCPVGLKIVQYGRNTVWYSLFKYPTRFYLKTSYNASAISADYRLETPSWKWKDVYADVYAS